MGESLNFLFRSWPLGQVSGSVCVCVGGGRQRERERERERERVSQRESRKQASLNARGSQGGAISYVSQQTTRKIQRVVDGLFET